MIKAIISVLHIMELLNLEKWKNYGMFTIILYICSNYLLVKDIFHLYFTLTLSDARKYLVKKENPIYPIVYIFFNLILVGLRIHLYAVSEEFILMLLIFFVNFLHHFLYKPSLIECDNLISKNNLSLGYGAALCYYENYLKYILQNKDDLVIRIRRFKTKEGVDNMSEKLFILIPFSCKLVTYIDWENISRCKELQPLEKNIAGIPDRNFNITVYHLRSNDSQKSVRLALEYAQPLKALFSLKERGLLSLRDMHQERKVFVESLKKMLSESKNSEVIHLIEYDDYQPLHVLSEVLMSVDAVYDYKNVKII